MKGLIKILLLVIFGIVHSQLAASQGDTLTRQQPIENLVINADVTIVLVDDNAAIVAFSGNDILQRSTKLEINGNTLVIEASKKRYLVDEGVIYLPASGLKRIWINSKARVRSLHTLRSPQLDVVVNGACEFSLSSMGEVNVTSNHAFAVDYSRFERVLPANFLVKRKGYAPFDANPN